MNSVIDDPELAKEIIKLLPLAQELKMLRTQLKEVRNNTLLTNAMPAHQTTYLIPAECNTVRELCFRINIQRPCIYRRSGVHFLEGRNRKPPKAQCCSTRQA